MCFPPSVRLERRNQILAVRDRLVDPSNALAASFEQVQVGTEARLTGISRVDRPPLWSAPFRESFRDELKVVGTRPFLERLEAGRRYARDQGRLLGLRLALLVALGSSLRALRSRAREKKEDYDLVDAEKVFEHPWAMALVIVLFLTNPLHPSAPRYAGALPALALGFAVLRIALSFLVSAMAPLAWGLIFLFMVDRGRTLLDTTPTLERVVLLFEMGTALGLQNVVSNPVSGLILLFERPIQVGDTVQLPDVWIGNFDDGYSTMSDLAVAVQEALDEAGIGVPFPQRDLHLVSVSPNAAAELERGTSLSPRGGTASDSHGTK